MISVIVIMYLIVGFWAATMFVLLPDNNHTVRDGFDFLWCWTSWPFPLCYLMATWPLAILRKFIQLLDYWVKGLRREN